MAGPLQDQCAFAAVLAFPEKSCAEARPTGDSEIGIEIWLPAENWNGKYEQLGNGDLLPR
jgi:hypothetical protein